MDGDCYSTNETSKTTVLVKFEFDEWKDLYLRDPEQFERNRKQALQAQVALASKKSRRRLQGLIFQMDAEARRARSANSYNMRLSAMMMDKFEQLRQQLALLTSSHVDVEVLPAPKRSADIIELDQFRSRLVNRPS